ncbi:MAG TPA: NADH-quinone oxidoreductase subunit J [Candidatus Thermoplasmatota archaeon]|nr:NADH-quinone oxidoreductase subunit J [Candidatus Thermoplasmatota archaeon]
MTRGRRNLLAALAALALFGLMAMAVRDAEGWATSPDTSALGESPQQLDALVSLLFGDHVLAFEVLGVLLTAAMIGALVVARPLHVKPDEDNYAKPTPEQLRESVEQSDVRSRLPEGRL